MRNRVKNQTGIFEDNLKLYEKLRNIKPRIPTKSQLTVHNLESDKIRKRISQYDILMPHDSKIDVSYMSKSIDNLERVKNATLTQNKTLPLDHPYVKTSIGINS